MQSGLRRYSTQSLHKGSKDLDHAMLQIPSLSQSTQCNIVKNFGSAFGSRGEATLLSHVAGFIILHTGYLVASSLVAAQAQPCTRLASAVLSVGDARQ